MSNLVVIFLSFFLLWTGLVFPMTSQETIAGAVLTFGISLLVYSKMKERKPFKVSGLFHLIKFLGIFAVELVKANIAMAKIVLTPSLPISPKIVKVRTSIQSKSAKALLANAITLTPGTLTIDLIEDELYIHIVDGNSIEHAEAILAPFEKDLKGGFDR